jgi:hypothetical protein
MEPTPITDAHRKANARLGWMLAAVAVMFGVGFVAKVAWLGW